MATSSKQPVESGAPQGKAGIARQKSSQPQERAWARKLENDLMRVLSGPIGATKRVPQLKK